MTRGLNDPTKTITGPSSGHMGPSQGGISRQMTSRRQGAVGMRGGCRNLAQGQRQPTRGATAVRRLGHHNRLVQVQVGRLEEIHRDALSTTPHLNDKVFVIGLHNPVRTIIGRLQRAPMGIMMNKHILCCS